jgi:hypothetical protein
VIERSCSYCLALSSLSLAHESSFSTISTLPWSQAIALAYESAVARVAPMHGKVARVAHGVARHHSLAVPEPLRRCSERLTTLG